MAYLLAVFKDTVFHLTCFVVFLSRGASQSPDSGFGGHFERTMLGSEVGCMGIVRFRFLNQLLNSVQATYGSSRAASDYKDECKKLY